MLSFLVRRLLLVLPTIFGVTLLAFALVHLIPGDPIDVIAGERAVTPERRAELETQFGLDRPLVYQYGAYLWRLAHGDLGRSLVGGRSVAGEFFARFPETVELAAAAIVLAVATGLPAGIVAAVRRNSGWDHAMMTAALTGYSMPIFWWGLLLIFLFSVQLDWTPVAGPIDVTLVYDRATGFPLIDTVLAGRFDAFVSRLHHLVLPAAVLGTIPMAVIARMTRAAMIETLSQDYIRTARAKGLPMARIVVGHALRNALIPIVTVIGLQVSLLLSGAILTETIFAWPGIGKWIVDAIARRDYPAIQGGVFLIACVVIAVNLAVDILYGLINPRVGHG